MAYVPTVPKVSTPPTKTIPLYDRVNRGPTQPEYSQLEAQFVTEVRSLFHGLQGEISERNGAINERDQYIYGDLLERSLSVPYGHDFTPVNWLRRTVEIHKNMFMSRGFQVISTYDTDEPGNAADEQDSQRIQVENQRRKAFAEQRKRLIDSIILDNGGVSFWSDLAENASAVGTSVVKAFYDEDEQKYVLSPVESVENFYALWNKNDFRSADAYAYVYQVSKQRAISEFGVDQNVATSPLGQPFGELGGTEAVGGTYTQEMVTVFEGTGKFLGWGSEKGSCKRVTPGKETEFNFLIVGNQLKRVIDDPKKLPRYYILPNKRQRRRPWGVSDVSDAAVNINATYVETLSDWRTVASKVNFPKYKAYNFGMDTQLPKSEPRKIQMLPLAEGQDIIPLDQGDANQIDFRQQMDELKEQFVRETGISRVLFDDPSVTLNSNQALLTSMKPTSDIAEAKKQLWAPVITQIFQDALDTLSEYIPEVKELVEGDDDWDLKVMWPSLMQKEDPVFQQMLLNRFNANTISIQSYLEAQGESKEELDRIRDELSDPTTAAILGHSVNQLAANLLAPPSDGPPPPKTSISLRGDLTPYQEANLASQMGFNEGPFPATAGPQGNQGLIAQENADNDEFLTDDAFAGGEPIQRGPNGEPVQANDTGQGQDVRPQVGTPANNQPGAAPMSQPGSGATPTSAQGALNQQNQQAGG